MWGGWLRHIEQSIRQRARMRTCARCKLWYLKSADKCPHCGHISDWRLRGLLKERRLFRTRLGGWMFFLAVLLCVALLVF